MSEKLSPSRKRFFSMLWHRHTCCSPGTIYTCFGAAVVNSAHLYRNCPRLCRWPVIPCLGTRHAHTFRYDMPKIRPISHPPPSLSRPFPFSPPSPFARCRPSLCISIYIRLLIVGLIYLPITITSRASATSRLSQSGSRCNVCFKTAPCIPCRNLYPELPGPRPSSPSHLTPPLHSIIPSTLSTVLSRQTFLPSKSLFCPNLPHINMLQNQRFLSRPFRRLQPRRRPPDAIPNKFRAT